MRFIGNKERLVGEIHNQIINKGVGGNSFFDLFAGTTSVSKFFKKKDYKIFSSDLLYFSYVLQKAYIENNEVLGFVNLLPHIKKGDDYKNPLLTVVNHLNNLIPVEGFIYKNYTPGGTKHLKQPRMYYSDYNGKMIDAMRLEIERFSSLNFINESEYFVLLACLIETIPFYANVSGVYAAFQKKWDPRAIKKIILRPIQYVMNNHHQNQVYNEESSMLMNIEADIYYLDPPYNQRQYAPNYHILETVAKYDAPAIKGVTGLRPYEKQKSKFCNRNSAIIELKKIAELGKYKSLILSYSSEGIMEKEQIFRTLSNYGKLNFIEIKYPRFKSNNNSRNKNKYLYEHLYILKK